MSEYKCENGNPPIYMPHKPVAGVIGASFSVVSIMVANILRLFKVKKILTVCIETHVLQVFIQLFIIDSANIIRIYEHRIVR